MERMMPCLLFGDWMVINIKQSYKTVDERDFDKIFLYFLYVSNKRKDRDSRRAISYILRE